MMEFLATNFNLPTIIGSIIVFGGVGWITWHTHKHGGSCADCGGHCGEGCGSCGGGCSGSCQENVQELERLKQIARKKANLTQ